MRTERDVYFPEAKTWKDVFSWTTKPWATPARERDGYHFIGWDGRDSRGGGWVIPSEAARAVTSRHLRELGGLSAIEWPDGRVLIVAHNRDHVGDIWLAMLPSAETVPLETLRRSTMEEVHRVDMADRKGAR
jgi:hypothetical protein